MSYGQELILDMHGCDVTFFTRPSIEGYFKELCEVINMEACDAHFWEDEYIMDKSNPKIVGISAIQFIVMSSITIHALSMLRSVYVNVCSGKEFSVQAAEVFTANWFEANNWHAHNIIRE